MLRAPLETVQELEGLALERVLEEFREWAETIREAEVLRQFEERPDRPFAYSRFESPLTSTVFYYLSVKVGEGDEARLDTSTVEAALDVDPAEIAEDIRRMESAKVPDGDEGLEPDEPALH